MPGRLVLGGDQTFVLGERRFDKPTDSRLRARNCVRFAARRMSCIPQWRLP